ncbi:uncharacterized protein PRCAT00005102001 [Priceomyces carsonii]|uniref:uncharacterized protein n=1 Tax=Priceomyces carsonii TaxID=28549 RepID=UPI002ED9B7C7|nr:unnamed protein product [Priceomyces carsonii]
MDVQIPFKRKRVRQACYFCRSKKSKCDGAQPTCSSCRKEGTKCTYPPIKKRGLPTGRLQELEKKLQLYEGILGYLITTGKDSLNVERKLHVISTEGEERARFLRNRTTLQKMWSHSQICERVALLDRSTETHQHASALRSSDSGSPYDYFKEEEWSTEYLRYQGDSFIVSGFSRAAVQRYMAQSPSKFLAPFRVSSIFRIHKSQKPPDISSSLYSFPEEYKILVDAYFQFINPLFPMLEKDLMMSFIEKVFNKKIQVSQKDAVLNTVALSWAVLSNGRYIMDATTKLLISTTASNVYASNATSVLEYGANSTIETIQTMLLIGYYEYCIGNWDLSWVLTSSAARMAIDVRLVEPSEEEFSKRSDPYLILFYKLSRTRTWEVAFILNTLLSARMGRSSVMKVSDWKEWDRSNFLNFEEVTDITNSNEYKYFGTSFDQTVKIISVLNLSVTSQFDTVGVTEAFLTPNVITFDYLEGRLNSIKEKIPSIFLMGLLNESVDIQNISLDVLIVHLMYNLTLCVIAVRLSEETALEGYKYSQKRRNNYYVEGALGLKRLLTKLSKKQLLCIPYLDYMLTICLTCSDMMTGYPCVAEKLARLLGDMSQNSRPCNIARDVISFEDKARGLKDILFDSSNSKIKGFREASRQEDSLTPHSRSLLGPSSSAEKDLKTGPKSGDSPINLINSTEAGFLDAFMINPNTGDRNQAADNVP